MIAPQFHRPHPGFLFPMPLPRSPRALEVAERFGLSTSPSPHPPDGGSGLVLPDAGQILLVTGPSGAGKSVRLKRLCREVAREDVRLVRVDRVPLRLVPCVDQFGDDLSLALDLLARVGLAEARVFVSLPDELSQGQCWRLRLAVSIFRLLRQGGLDRRRGLRPRKLALVADEFCAVLDRVTAAVVARCLRRTIDRLSRVGVPVRAIVATSHDDLQPSLLPDRIARVDFDGVRLALPDLPTNRLTSTRRSG